MKHAHAELLHRLAEDCTLQVWTWVWSAEASSDSRWIYSNAVNVSNDTKGQHRYALGDKPTSPPKKYAMVEGVRVPMTHLTVAPTQRLASYWYLDSQNNVAEDAWTWDNVDCGRINYQNCYATESDAQEAATAWAQVRKIAAERAK